MERSWDVLVVGLGHAGCEAALAAARMGLRVLALTFRASGAAVMSCNPAVGGTAKGHLVRELDALGGEMGRVADQTALHVRTLNASRGPAVQATRMACDRGAYASAFQAVLRAEPRLRVLETQVTAVRARGGRVEGVRLADGAALDAPAVVLTTGTFLRASLHRGAERSSGGRRGEGSAEALSTALEGLGVRLRRFRTGTPPRLRARSIDWSRCPPQPADLRPRPFSWRTGAFPVLPQRACHVTHTNEATHGVVRANLHRSPLFDGSVRGAGPRYCPSLEHKVVRFPDRPRHTVFLQPEGVDSALVYPAGLSTSLPPEVQVELLRTLPGLECVEVAEPGYAVEYDYAPPTQLLRTLEVREIRGLYFAGQINGTSGYEEAAVQGLLAGINAARAVQGRSPLILGREEAHAGVLVDELVTRGVDEPFRMLTARSEHRLLLREGNADLRLTARGVEVGLVPAVRLAAVERRRTAIRRELERLESAGLSARLRQPGVDYASLAAADAGRPALGEDVTGEVETEIKYAGYVARHRRAVAQARAEDRPLPEGFADRPLRGVSAEVRAALLRHRPQTLEEAGRLPGVTAGALEVLRVHLHWQESEVPGIRTPVENMGETHGSQTSSVFPGG